MLSLFLLAIINGVIGSPVKDDLELDRWSIRSLENGAGCGYSMYGSAMDKIVGGHEARPYSFPWLASLWVEDADYAMDQHQCGAAVIDNQFLLTAAHCFLGYDKASSWKVVLGEHNFKVNSGKEVWRNVSKIITHENYDMYEMKNDIALVKLDKPLELLPSANMAINSICMPSATDSFVGAKCKVAGWGALRDYGSVPDALQEVTLPVIGPQKCNQYNHYKGIIWASNICAGFDEGGKDSCQGDSGGPLMCVKPDGRFYLAGVVSWGMGCAAANAPGVYTNTVNYLQWIEANMEANR